MTRWKASAIHLALSVLIVGTLATLMLWRWYPPALVEVTGADTVLPLIAGVDVVMGPLLTLVVYQHGKKTLKFDLAVIGLLQVAAMLYGLHAAWITRPVFIAASDTKLTLVIANEFSARTLRDAPESYRRLPVFGPHVVGLKAPKPGDEDLLEIAGPRMPSQFQPYEAVAGKLAANAMPVDALAATLEPQSRERLRKAVRRLGVPTAGIVAVPIQSIRGRATMLLDRATGQLLKPVAVHMPKPPAEKPPGAAAAPPASPAESGRRAQSDA